MTRWAWRKALPEILPVEQDNEPLNEEGEITLDLRAKLILRAKKRILDAREELEAAQEEYKAELKALEVALEEMGLYDTVKSGTYKLEE